MNLILGNKSKTAELNYNVNRYVNIDGGLLLLVRFGNVGIIIAEGSCVIKVNHMPKPRCDSFLYLGASRIMLPILAERCLDGRYNVAIYIVVIASNSIYLANS